MKPPGYAPQVSVLFSIYQFHFATPILQIVSFPGISQNQRRVFWVEGYLSMQLHAMWVLQKVGKPMGGFMFPLSQHRWVPNFGKHPQVKSQVCFLFFPAVFLLGNLSLGSV